MVVLVGGVSESSPLDGNSIASSSRRDSIDSLAIDYAPQYLFQVKIEDVALNCPTGDWIPVSDFEDEMFNIDALTFNMGNMKGIQIPKGHQIPTLSMTFYDSMQRDIYIWLKDWARSISSTQGYTNYLDDVGRKMFVMKLDGMRNPVVTTSYIVWPIGSVSVTNDGGNSTLEQIRVTFAVASLPNDTSEDSSIFGVPSISSSASGIVKGGLINKASDLVKSSVSGVTGGNVGSFDLVKTVMNINPFYQSYKIGTSVGTKIGEGAKGVMETGRSTETNIRPVLDTDIMMVPEGSGLMADTLGTGRGQ